MVSEAESIVLNFHLVYNILAKIKISLLPSFHTYVFNLIMRIFAGRMSSLSVKVFPVSSLFSYIILTFHISSREIFIFVFLTHSFNRLALLSVGRAVHQITPP